jgi:hypothetical protein
MIARLRKQTGGLVMGVRPQTSAPQPPPFAAAEIPFGNRVLTMIGVWLEA